MSKYSKKVRTESGRVFRYNYTERVLEYLGTDGKVVTSQGLREDSWTSDGMSYVKQYEDELDEELNWLMKDLEDEF